MSHDVVVGVDPDSKKHGIAIYKNNSLVELKLCSLIDCVELMRENLDSKWVVEEVTANNFVYARNNQKTKALQAQVGRSIGKNQQAMIELVRFLDDFKINYILIPPSKGNWSKNKEKFQSVTGWTKRSNEDTRSAAYFGFMGL